MQASIEIAQHTLPVDKLEGTQEIVVFYSKNQQKSVLKLKISSSALPEQILMGIFLTWRGRPP